MWKLGVIAVFLTCYSLHAASNNWLANVNDDFYLSEISIPGTHDSGARYEPFPGTAKCQDLTIGQQLSAGIRYLDIRCRHYYDTFEIHHGQVYQNINFGDVLSDCTVFLSANPTETIIMSVKQEYDSEGNTLSFEQVFDNYVAQNPGMWYLGDTLPQLGDVRGKIVLFRRFSASTAKGLNATQWPDNTTFTISGNAPMRVQDYYNCSGGSAKWTNVTNMLSEAEAGSLSTLYLNYTSGYKSGLFGIPSITTISDYVNPRLGDYFSANTSGRFGVIVMDFANAARSEQIYKTNDLAKINVDLNANEYNYDFGTLTSPVMSGWTRISTATNGDIDWNCNVNSADRGPISGVNDINRDFVYNNTPAALEHKIANGLWAVTLNMGDADYAHDNMIVKAEGIIQAADVDSDAGQFPYVMFEIAVIDGSLSIELSDAGGDDANWVLTRMSLSKIGEVIDLSKTKYDYDFGTPTSPVMNGWARISEETSGDISWSEVVGSRDRGAISGINDINRDLVQSSLRTTLEHRISNGLWTVTLNMGDADYAHDNMVVKAEGTVMDDDIDNDAAEFPYVIFEVPVIDGSLSIEFSDAGGDDANWVLTRMSLQKTDYNYNDDCIINLEDFADLAAYWQNNININDLLLFSQQWLENTCAGF